VFFWTNKPMPAGIQVEQYVWAAFTVWFTFAQIMGSISASRGGSPIPFPGVSAMHMRLAICAWPVMINIIFTFGSVFLMILFGDNIPVPNIPLTAFILVVTATFALGLGLCFGAMGRAVPLIDPFLHMLPYFLFLGSGIYYSITNIPLAMANIFIWSPLLHLVEFERHAFDPGYPIGLVNLWYPFFCAVGVLVLGLALSKRIR
jgi:ABC-type polysaccharide/polyol phosphate export permease